MNPHDLFGMMGGMGGMGGMPMGMMGGMGGGGRRRQVAIRCDLEVDLSLLYKGGSKPVELPETTMCKECNGRGVKLVRRMISNAMVQQMQVPCETCGSEGIKVNEDKTKKVDVRIRAGMKDKQQIPLDSPSGRDDEPSVVVVLSCKDHDTFTRQGDDLVVKKTITLQEALLGFNFELEHLDGRKLLVQSPVGKVITYGQKMMIKGEGMPRMDGPGAGDLIIIFALEFPRSLGEDQTAVLKKVLPPGRKIDSDNIEEPEECFMEDWDPEEWKQRGGYGEEEEDDEDEQGGGQQVRCAAQ
eukprot:TRINITY_DN4960_c0_g1_i1.p2 TRINITY_DN4960_c0_g1~~TRINITY_DN4960_c0_g1_i1.p2  ORF type:complete len:298 (+),score=153.26 TRINITY_DN4960_c0_g1_i1:55-948(+)